MLVYHRIHLALQTHDSVHGVYFVIEQGERGFGYQQKICSYNYSRMLIESICFAQNNVSTLLSMTDGVWLPLVTGRHGKCRRQSGLVNYVLVSKSSRMFLCWASWQLTCYVHMHTASLRIPVFIGIHTTIWTVKATWQSISSGKGWGKPQMGYYTFKEDQISYSLSIVGTLR